MSDRPLCPETSAPCDGTKPGCCGANTSSNRVCGHNVHPLSSSQCSLPMGHSGQHRANAIPNRVCPNCGSADAVVPLDDPENPSPWWCSDCRAHFGHDTRNSAAKQVEGRTWDGVSFYFPPGSRDMKKLIEWAEMNGFQVEDWCDWRRADGAVFTIYPTPAPPQADRV